MWDQRAKKLPKDRRTRRQLAIPTSLRKEVLQHSHDSNTGRGHTFLQQEIITKLQEYIHEILKFSPPELLGHFYNIYTSNYNFAQMYSLI